MHWLLVRGSEKLPVYEMENKETKNASGHGNGPSDDPQTGQTVSIVLMRG